MEYNIADFTTRLRELMYLAFPNLPERGKNASGTPKHKTDNQEIRNVAFKNNLTISELDQTIFEIGNELSEEKYPYYHILEDSPVIRKRGKGTKKTKGSQAEVKELGKRDYGIVKWNGKTFSKEYTRNVRGSRNRLASVSHWEGDTFVNRESNAYQNTHYHYIENMLNGGILDTLATEFGLKRARTIDTGLAEEYFSQDDADFGNILDIIGSHD